MCVVIYIKVWVQPGGRQEEYFYGRRGLNDLHRSASHTGAGVLSAWLTQQPCALAHEAAILRAAVRAVVHISS